jgi:DNA invertase Pin-like site-specific DNA recombinase
MNGKLVAYHRVSTTKQGQSGLGLEAQRSAVTTYLNSGSWELVAELTENEGGRKNPASAPGRSPTLQKAEDNADHSQA